jgi:hypothetical protein
VKVPSPDAASKQGKEAYLKSELKDDLLALPNEIATHPEGMQEGSQGQAKRSPWSAWRRTRALKGARPPAIAQSCLLWRPSRTRFFFRTNPGAALRLPLATFLHPFGMLVAPDVR